VLAIDVALERLAQVDEHTLRVVESRIFAGLTLEETAETLGLSATSVQRTWSTARARLRKEIGRVQSRSAVSSRRATCRDH
jgi:DNA-directed RNA polymerase specialized sigma24 family protein